MVNSMDNPTEGDGMLTRLPALTTGIVEQVERQEIAVLAHELANSYKFLIDVHRRNAKVSDQEESAAYSYLSDAPYKPDDYDNGWEGIEWFHLDALQRKDPAAMLTKWQAIKKAAVDELQSGHTAAMSITSSTGDDTPWQRAQFLAIRNGLIQEWQPRGGGEMLLIDMMAQSYHRYLHWLELEVLYTDCDAVERKTKQKRGSYDWEPPRVSKYQAIEQASQMSDRYNRMFLRNLRQLRDLRRYTQPLHIQHAGQINITQGGQQLNVQSDRV